MVPGYGEWIREMDMYAAKVAYAYRYPWTYEAQKYYEKVAETNKLYPNPL